MLGPSLQNLIHVNNPINTETRLKDTHKNPAELGV